MFLCLVTSTASAQTIFQKTFKKQQIGGFWSMTALTNPVQTFDGGYAVIMTTGYFDIFMMKTDESGSIQWTLFFGDTMFNSAMRLQQTLDSGFIISGNTGRMENNGFYQLLLSKVSQSGQLEWAKFYSQGGVSESPGYYVQQTRDDGFIVTGVGAIADSLCNFSSKLFLLKTNADGNLEWSKTFSDSAYDCGFCVEQTFDGGFIIAGRSGSNYYDMDIALIKTDSAGNLEWGKRAGGTNCDEANSVKQLKNGGYILTGYTASFGLLPRGFIMKADASGNIQSFKTFEAYGQESGNDIELTNDGGYIIAGTRSDSTRHGFILKLDSLENLQWSKSFGGVLWNAFSGIRQTNDGGFIISGLGQDVWAGYGKIDLIKTDEQGNSACAMIDDSTIILDEPCEELSGFTELPGSFVEYEWPLSSQQILVSENIVCISTNVSNVNDSNRDFKIFPNPSHDFISIKHESLELQNIIIVNSLGQVIYEKLLSNDGDIITLNVSQLPNGFYLLRLQCGDKFKMETFVKD